MSNLHLTFDVFIGIVLAESLKFLVIKFWEYIDHHHRTPLDLLDID